MTCEDRGNRDEAKGKSSLNRILFCLDISQ